MNASRKVDDTGILIIGAGIIGLALGLTLQMAGRRVTIIDRDEPASGASFGNAGYLAEGNIFPPASPEVLKKLPALLLDKNGPLVVKPHYVRTLIPWGLRVLASTRPTRQAEIVNALAVLNRRAIASYDPLLNAARAESLFTSRGSLVVCKTEDMLAQKKRSIPALLEQGIQVEGIGREDILSLEPCISREIVGGLYYPNNVHCVSPGRLGQRFAEAIERNGGAILRGAVQRIQPVESGWHIETLTGSLHAMQLVVCAGWWSGNLLQPLGYKAPLASERGYHLMLPQPGVSLGRPVVMAEHYFAATPMMDGIRLAGTAEFADPTAKMDVRRANILHSLATPYLPGLLSEGATRWMGVRPSFPDALPAIGRAGRHNGLFYSFGHQHVGLTQGAISARLLAEAILEGSVPSTLQPFDLSRFQV